ncbi:MAG: hypothetical protein LBH91_05665 [Prevotellaceae bacterium]|jgi:hypothetical protein|nr:hypothetical protein [Prevotellaceae bacterium]
MQTTTQLSGIMPRTSLAQQNHYASMNKFTDIDKLNLKEELSEDECRRLFESRLDANGIYILTPEQRASIAKTRQQYAQGRYC